MNMIFTSKYKIIIIRGSRTIKVRVRVRVRATKRDSIEGDGEDAGLRRWEILK
jgi:hypothetical protein